MKTSGLSTRRIYNPGWLSDDAIESGFVVRRELLRFLCSELAGTSIDGTTQHYVLVGVRGSGKTTLLRRLAVAIRRDPALSHLIALGFPEELYHLKSLADFWWSACDSLCEELQRLRENAHVLKLRAAIDARRVPGPAGGDEDAGLQLLLSVCAACGKRPVVLVDNFDLVLQRIDKRGRKLKDPHSAAYWALREVLSRRNSPIVIGASVRLTEPFVQYDTAFYDFFVPKMLGRLSLEEVRSMLAALARTSHAEHVLDRLRKRRGRVRALHDLTGGNPRAVTLLFDLLRQAPDGHAVEDFEHLMDITTPYYKARLEELSEQAQVVMYALALCNRNATAAEVGQKAGLETRTVSAQLDVLERAALVFKASGRGRARYAVAEQLFRLWLQARGGSRFKEPVIYLTEFLEAFYDSEELEQRVPRAVIPDPTRVEADRVQYRSDSVRPLTAAGLSDAHERLLTSGLPSGEIESIRAAQSRGLMRLPHLLPGDVEAAAAGMRNPELLLIGWKLLLRGLIAIESVESARAWIAFGASCLSPLSSDQWAQLASLLRRKKWWEPAESCVAHALRSRPGVLAWLEAALLNEALSKDPRESESALRRCLELDPNEKEALYHLGIILSDRMHRRDEAERVIRRALEVDSADARLWYELSKVLSGLQHREGEAEQALRRALELKPENPCLWYELGLLCSRQTGSYVEAESALRRAIELGPALFYAWYELGNLLSLGLGRYEEAESAYHEALNRRPDSPHPWYALGLLQALYLEQPANAEFSFRKAIELAPDDPKARNGLGMVLTRLARYDEAEDVFRQSIQLDPHDPDSWNALGAALFASGKSDKEAERAYRTAIELDPANDGFWCNLGTLLESIPGREDEAESAYGKAFAIDPESPFTRESIDRLKRKRVLRAVAAAIQRDDWSVVREFLSRVTSGAGADWSVIADTAFVDEVLAPAAESGRGVMLFDLLRESGFERLALPLVVAFESYVKKDPALLSTLPTEVQGATSLVFKRLVEAAAEAARASSSRTETS